jgi:Ni/Co efflux regulator RcnB
MPEARMTPVSKVGLSFAVALLAAGSVFAAQADRGPERGTAERGQPERGAVARPGAGRPPAPHAQPAPAPTRYRRVAAPKGWNSRPATVDQSKYQHNFKAAHSYRIGPYVRPPGWVAQHWAYGQTLPPAYWTPEYLIADYWLFSLQVPPVGYEWVRDDDDAILVNTATGEILQVEYGVFS